ncbi:MAG: hypothetical protein DDT21_02199 [Syntrophomonadaceae bacterium]|nr:hypothetical protein [Bacillota bacterium]
MFYWSHRDIHIVLSNEEELSLVQKLGKDPLERIGYHVSRKDRKEIEQRIFRYLEDSLYADPEAFNRRFVFRSWYDEDAQKMFSMMLDAYGRITRRATIGRWRTTAGRWRETAPLGEINEPIGEELVEAIVYAKKGVVYRITLFERPRWPWALPLVSGHISLPASSIKRLCGTVDNFFVASDTVTIKFHRDFVRISILL